MEGVKEKKMFGSVAFMANGRMFMSARASRIMCRVDPRMYDELLRTKACQPMRMKGREYKGFIVVEAKYLISQSQLKYWIDLALEFNSTVAAKGR